MRLFVWLLMIPRLFLQSVGLALAQVWANKVRSVLTMTGIVIGVSSVTAVIAALTGLRTNVLNDFAAIGSSKIFAAPYRPETGPLHTASFNRIQFEPEQFDGLLEHCPSIETFTRVAVTRDSVRCADKNVADVLVFGIDPAWHKVDNRWVLSGRPFSHVDAEQGTNVCLIDAGLREKLQLDRDCVGQSIMIGSRTFVIVGLLENRPEFSFGRGGGGIDYEVFVPFNTVYRTTRSMSHIEAIARSPEVSSEARAEMRFFLRGARRLQTGEPDTFRIEAVEEYLRKFNEIATVITLVAGGIVGISLLVGGVGIMNIMLVSVSERTREIGLRKAVGATPSAVLLQFLVEAVMVCLVGGLIGLGIGQLLTKAMASIPGAKLGNAYIPLWAMGLSFGFSALVGVVFGMFPAIKAARLDPIVALRHE